MAETSEPMNNDSVHWKWFGTPGHLCVAKWCRFHLCTKVGKYLVSTVGEYIHPYSHGFKSERDEGEWLNKNLFGEEIGFGRKFETMVFRAGKPCTTKDCNCGLPELGGSELETNGYNDRRSATIGHLKLCRKWAKR